MKSELVKERIRTVCFMFGVTFVAISVLSIVDIVTRPAVERNRTVFLKQAVRAATGLDPVPGVDSLLVWYEQAVTEIKTPEGDYDYFHVDAGAGARRLVLIQRGAGLWGSITAFVGFDAQAEAIRGVTFQDHVETPGLGARIDEPWFRGQFKGKSGPFVTLRPEPKDKNRFTEDNDAFDQITGATITSTAVKDIMNKSIERARTVAGR